MEMRYYFSILYVSLAHISREIAPFRCVLGETRPHLPTLSSNHMCVFLTTTFLCPFQSVYFSKIHNIFILSLFNLYCNDSQYIIIYTQLYTNLQEFPGLLKVRLWVLMHDQTLTHLSTDISLISKHNLNHNISLGS